MDVLYKCCFRCKMSKPVTAFGKDRSKKGGYYPSCIECTPRRRHDPVKKAEYDRKYRSRPSHYPIKKSRQLQVPFEILREIYETSSGKCEICGEFETAKSAKDSTKVRQLALDHCHKTGGIRGLLCGKCNTGLGVFRDNTDILFRAIQYLNKFQENQK